MQATGAISASLLIKPSLSALPKLGIEPYMPDEADPHERTWMAFGASEEIWGKKLLPEVQRNLANIALAIAKYEPVSMLVRKNDYAIAKKLMGETVTLHVTQLDDLWMRDTSTVFVLDEAGKKAAVDFNFNGWGNKQVHAQDSQVAALVAKLANVNTIHTKLVLEGGGIEVDGYGTAIIAESCVLNANRNPGVSKKDFEDEIKSLLGLEKIIWIPGIKDRDITDGHTDFYARFASPGVVLVGYDADSESYDHAVTKKHIDILRAATDAQGRQLEVIVLKAPSKIRPKFASNDFAAGYIGFYVCNDAVISQEFGDKRADLAAKKALKKAFPSRKIVQINVDGIASGGGSIHCTTQQEPKSFSPV
jgi:agmatine deiminase